METEGHSAGLAVALRQLAGTNAEEQVFIVPADGSESWHLDVVELEEEDGPRFAVYAEYGGDVPFDERGLPLPKGSVVDADEGSNATITFGTLTADEAATLLVDWASRLSNDVTFSWSTTWD